MRRSCVLGPAIAGDQPLVWSATPAVASGSAQRPFRVDRQWAGGGRNGGLRLFFSARAVFFVPRSAARHC